MLVGILSDTHGKLLEPVKAALVGVDHIIHAGDIGARRVLDELQLIAPLTAVRGNAEHDELEWRLTDRAVVELAGSRVLVFHDPSALKGRVPEGVDIIVNGHTHRWRIEQVEGILHINPGSAGMRGRDGRGPTIALLELAENLREARIVDV